MQLFLGNTFFKESDAAIELYVVMEEEGSRTSENLTLHSFSRLLFQIVTFVQETGRAIDLMPAHAVEVLPPGSDYGLEWSFIYSIHLSPLSPWPTVALVPTAPAFSRVTCGAPRELHSFSDVEVLYAFTRAGINHDLNLLCNRQRTTLLQTDFSDSGSVDDTLGE